MYRLIPLRTLRRTSGVKFDEIIPSDIPKVDAIDKVIHGPNTMSPGPTKNIIRPWYKHSKQENNLLVLQGTRYMDIYDPKTQDKASFIITPDKIYKNEKLYYDGPAMVVWPSGTFHRIISGDEGSVSINFAARERGFEFQEYFNIYDLNTETGSFTCIKNGEEKPPDLDYKWPNNKIRSLVKNDSYETNLNYESRGVLEMYNDQHYQEYKEFKRRAAAERFNRGKNFIK